MLRFSCSEKPLGADATLWPNVTQINCQSPVAPTRRLTALGLRKQTTGIAAECLHVDVVVRICLWGLGDPSRLEIINTPLNPRHTGTWCVFTEFPFALHVVGCIYIGIKSSSRFKYFPEGKKISPWVELPMEIAYKKMPISKLSHIGYPTNDDHNLNIGNSDSYSWNWVNFQSDSFESKSWDSWSSNYLVFCKYLYDSSNILGTVKINSFVESWLTKIHVSLNIHPPTSKDDNDMMLENDSKYTRLRNWELRLHSGGTVSQYVKS